MSETLIDAIDAGDVGRVAELLADGADPNVFLKSNHDSFWDGSTPLLDAVMGLQPISEHEPGGPIDTVVLLLRYGADVNRWDEKRRSTPLLNAVFANSIEAVRILLAVGADPNVRGAEGDSPLRLCAQHGYLEIARLLLHCGAGKTIHEGGGPTGMNALGFAATRLNIDMIRLLLSHGADPLAWDADGRTPSERLEFASLPKDPDSQERLRKIRQLLTAPESADPISSHRSLEK